MRVVNPVNAPLNTWPSIQLKWALEKKRQADTFKKLLSPTSPQQRHSNRMHLDKRGCVATVIWPMPQTHFSKWSKSVHSVYIRSQHGAAWQYWNYTITTRVSEEMCTKRDRHVWMHVDKQIYWVHAVYKEANINIESIVWLCQESFCFFCSFFCAVPTFPSNWS